jgi:hypothetical protein
VFPLAKAERSSAPADGLRSRGLPETATDESAGRGDLSPGVSSGTGPDVVQPVEASSASGARNRLALRIVFMASFSPPGTLVLLPEFP